MQLLAYAACYSDITEPDRVCQFIELNETVKGNELSFSLTIWDGENNVCCNTVLKYTVLSVLYVDSGWSMRTKGCIL